MLHAYTKARKTSPTATDRSTSPDCHGGRSVRHSGSRWL